MIDIYAYKVPVFILLSVNSSFLVWIMMVRYRTINYPSLGKSQFHKES